MSYYQVRGSALRRATRTLPPRRSWRLRAAGVAGARSQKTGGRAAAAPLALRAAGAAPRYPRHRSRHCPPAAPDRRGRPGAGVRDRGALPRHEAPGARRHPPAQRGSVPADATRPLQPCTAAPSLGGRAKAPARPHSPGRGSPSQGRGSAALAGGRFVPRSARWAAPGLFAHSAPSRPGAKGARRGSVAPARAARPPLRGPANGRGRPPRQPPGSAARPCAPLAARAFSRLRAARALRLRRLSLGPVVAAPGLRRLRASVAALWSPLPASAPSRRPARPPPGPPWRVRYAASGPPGSARGGAGGGCAAPFPRAPPALFMLASARVRCAANPAPCCAAVAALSRWLLPLPPSRPPPPLGAGEA